MWNLTFTPPQVIEAHVLTPMPDALRQKKHSAWADANKSGHVVDSFLEGPVFDRFGNLYVVDIPHGRVFRISAALEWQLVVEYDGWPNGLAMHADGSLWIADYRRGVLRVTPSGAPVETIVGHRNSESFKGVNDLTFDLQGRLYFTDQGQTGLHDPSGRVYRMDAEGRLDLLLTNVPSPNGLALNAEATTLFVAVTRANQVWCAPLLADGGVSKVGALQTFFGNSGPDGLAATVDGGVVVAHASLGGAFVLNGRGEVTHFVRSPKGQTVTNIAFRPGTRQLVMTESATGCILQADLPVAGQPLYSHAFA